MGQTQFAQTFIYSNFLLCSLVLTCCGQQSLQPGDTQLANSNSRSVAKSIKTPPKHVGLRMAKWKTVHGHQAKQTAELISTLKEIGCEVRENNHGNHIDVSFRCISWKTIKVNNDEQITQWQTWLAKSGFETVVLNPSEQFRLPTVSIQLTEWKTIHTKNKRQAEALKETYDLVGCETVLNNHGNHIDLKFRCVDGATLGFANSKAAHIWLAWLSRAGFETHHDHATDAHNAELGVNRK